MTDREKVFDAIRNCITEPKCKDCPWEDCEKFGCKRVTVPVTLLLDTLKLLKEQPEQKHGHWIRSPKFLPETQCSVCKKTYVGDCWGFNFCPECGARMDEEVKQE